MTSLPMSEMWPILLLMLVACGSGSDDNAAIAAGAPVAEAPSKAAPACVLPKLEFDDSKLKPEEEAEFSANFRVALDRACAEGLLAEPLVDQRSIDKNTIVVVNASEANVTSIYYAPSGAPPAMLMESPMRPPAPVPSADDLHEAIYCAVKGATPEEEEESGRCLPD